MHSNAVDENNISFTQIPALYLMKQYHDQLVAMLSGGLIGVCTVHN